MYARNLPPKYWPSFVYIVAITVCSLTILLKNTSLCLLRVCYLDVNCWLQMSPTLQLHTLHTSWQHQFREWFDLQPERIFDFKQWLVQLLANFFVIIDFLVTKYIKNVFDDLLWDPIGTHSLRLRVIHRLWLFRKLLFEILGCNLHDAGVATWDLLDRGWLGRFCAALAVGRARRIEWIAVIWLQADQVLEWWSVLAWPRLVVRLVAFVHFGII